MREIGTHKEADVWNAAVTAVKKEFALLPGTVSDRLGILLADMKRLKTAIFELTRSVEGEAVCAICQGGCCDTGKYHFTVVDLLVYIIDGKELFIPDFAGSRCPYLGIAGCLMEPEYRPFNCITFHCEQLEPLLSPSDVREFYAVERRLRILYNTLEEFFGNKFAYGLLANYENGYVKRGTVLFGERFHRKIDGGCNGDYL